MMQRRAALFGFTIVIAACKTQPASESEDSPPTSSDALAESGQTDVAITPDALLPSDGGSVAWDAVAAASRCGLGVARNPGAFQPLSWTSCGKGCQVASAAPLGYAAYRALASVVTSTSGTYLRSVSGSESARIATVSRLSDNTVVAVVRQTADLGACTFVGRAAADTSFALFADNAIFAATLRDAALSWPTTWTKVAAPLVTQFSFDEGLGATLRDGTVALVTKDAPNAKTVDTNATYATAAFARSKLAVWAYRTAGKDVLRALPSGGTVRTLATRDASVRSLAFDDERIAWIEGHGPAANDGLYTSADVVTSPYSTEAAGVIPSGLVTLPAAVGLSELQVSGSYVASLRYGTDGKNPAVVVIHLSTKAVSSLPSRPGSEFVRVLGLTADEIILGESDSASGAAGAQILGRVLRLKLSELGRISAGGW